MKKIIITIILFGVTLLQAYEYEVTTTIGVNVADNKSKFKDALPLYGLRGTVYINDLTSFQLGYERAESVDYKDVIKNSDIQRVYSNIVLTGEKELNMSPYLLLGIGYESLEIEKFGEKSQPFFNIGVGAKYHYSEVFNFAFEAKMIKKADTSTTDYTGNLNLNYLIK